MDGNALKLVVSDFYAEAKDTVVIELKHQNAQQLPPFTAGSHLEVYLANGMIRHYSILNASADRQRYLIAVGLVPESRGGSSYIHQHIRVGDILTVSPPRNNFELADHEEYCFIAGGIGITPILSMIHWCIAHNKKWRLVYALRNKQRASFFETLHLLAPENIQFHFNDEQQDQHLNVDQIIQSLSEKEHVYCCGPIPMMQSVQKHTQYLAKERIHFEWFAAPTDGIPQRNDDREDEQELDEFIVKLKQSGQEIPVLANQSILEALEQVGIDLPYSCRSGICRTCETAVCSGTPAHHDMVLSDEERASNQTMLICVSRSKSPVLVLDL